MTDLTFTPIAADAPPSGGLTFTKMEPSLGQQLLTTGQHVLNAGEKTLQDMGMTVPMPMMAQNYPREGKGPIENIIHAAKLAGSETAQSLGLVFGPEESASQTALGAIQPTASPAEQAAIRLENKARSQISKTFNRQGGNPSAVDVHEALQKAKAEGQPLTLADVGGTEISALAGTTYRQGGPARAQIQKFSEGRIAPETAIPRVKGLIDKYLTDKSYLETYDELRNVRSANARPLWEAAANHGPLWSDRLAQLFQQPELQQGIRRGWHIERRKAIGQGVPFRPQDYAVTDFNEAGDPIITGVPNARLWMVAKEGLDAKIGELESQRRFGRPSKDELSYMDLRNGLIEELDRLNPAYKQARDVWAGDTAMVAALRRGRNFWRGSEESGGFTPEELARYYPQLSESEKEAFTLGVADTLKEKLYSTKDARDKGRALVDSEGMRMRLRTITGSDNAAKAFIDALEREHLMHIAPATIYKGSQTAGRMADDRAELSLRAAHTLMQAINTHVIGALWSAARVVHMLGREPNLTANAEIGKLLTNPNVEVATSGRKLLPPREVPRTRVSPGVTPQPPQMFAPLMQSLFPSAYHNATGQMQ